MNETIDVLIIGAGVSGINMACRLKAEQPHRRFLVLERRERIGGTWDLFRYPGVRSDSDMFTYGFQFKPWRDYRTLADGESIRRYLRDTARDMGVLDQIEYGIHCTSAEWDSREQRWTVTAVQAPGGEVVHYKARFIVSCQGYFSHDQGYQPQFEGQARFQGQLIHPQQWPENLDYTGKKVVVIGSGATAVTLVPALAEKAAAVTMLQRSPTYIFSLPGWDRMTQVLSKILPFGWSFALARKRNLHLWQTTYRLCKRYPKAARKFFVGQARRHLGERFTQKDFNLRYEPWDQRLCAVPDANLFTAIRSGKASVVTDGIAGFTADGIRLVSGKELKADIVVTATGLALQLFGGMRISVDGAPYDASRKMIYKSVLLQDLPNFGWVFGYINLSWTMKADMSSLYLCRLLDYLDQTGASVVIPRDRQGMALESSVMEQLSAGYVQRDKHLLPRQGRAQPWMVRNHYHQDRKMMLEMPIADPQHLETIAPLQKFAHAA
ncbi:TPA: NAD(P)/FAD-dependent oxidoreductase [Pseudomonas aeruginosa]|nr:NAD(P)/FAD-dependent oxidoreductase [Pseudomonas aeruginosa]